MTLRTSLVLAGDASGAVAALEAVDAGLSRASKEADAVAAAFKEVDDATRRLATAQTLAKVATDSARKSLEAGKISQFEYNQTLLETKTGLSLVSSSQTAATASLRKAQAAYDDAIAGATALKTAHGGVSTSGLIMQHVLRSTTDSFAAGLPPSMIFAEQIGRIGEAAALSKGVLGSFGEFLAGPWGLALTAAVSIAASLVPALLHGADAAKENEKALADLGQTSDSLSSAQSLLAKMFDLNSGAIEHNTEVLRFNIKMMAVALEAKARLEGSEARDAARKAGTENWSTYIGRTISNAGSIAGSAQTGYDSGQKVFDPNTQSRALIDAVINAPNSKAAAKAGSAALEFGRKADFSKLSLTQSDFETAVKKAVDSKLDQESSKGLDDAYNGKLEAMFHKDEKAKTPRKKAKGPDLVKFGQDEEDRIAKIRDQFSDIPPSIVRANTAMRELDKIAYDLQKKSPPDYKRLKPEIDAAGQAIRDSLNKPFNDYIQAQRESSAIDQLLIAGRDDEAAALKIALQLQKDQGGLLPGQLDTVLATVQAERERGKVLRDQRALIQENLNAVQDVRGALEQSVGNIFRARFSLDAVFSSIGNSFIAITSKRIVESMFGDTLRALEDQATGQDKVRAASDGIANALNDGGTAVKTFAQVVYEASRKISASSGGSAASAVGSAIGSSAGSSGGGDQYDPTTGEYIDAKTGERYIGAKASTPAAANSASVLGGAPNGSFLITMAAAIFGKATGIAVPKLVIDYLKPVLSKIEQVIPNAITGAFTGSAASKLILGSGGSSIGGAIGGVIGQKVGEKFLSSGLSSIAKGLGSFAGPIGSVVGGLLGGLLGGLFTKAKTGGASVGVNQYGQAGVTGSGGNNATLKGNTNTLGGTIGQGLNQIASTLGASIGTFAVAIGQRQDYYRVSASGSIANATAKHYGSDVIYDGKDQAQAVSVAIANAIADGAIAGISDKVKAALTSSSDIDAALREAVKVQNVELLLGGLDASLKKAFSDFDVQAKDRLRIAQQYGFDVVALEKRNAEDRLKLAQKLLADQVSSLQTLIDDLTTGSLFEGSAVDQRKALLDKITTTKADAAAGVDGAAEKLANLLSQFNTVSKDAYGTTGGFATDRATILDIAQTTIAAANQRVNDAQAASDPALADTNAALDENNAQNAQILAALGITNGQLQALIAQGGLTNSGALANLARTSNY